MKIRFSTAVAFGLMACLLPGALLAQPKGKKDPAAEAMKEELQIVQEYIEEQGATITQLKKQMGELAAVKSVVDKQVVASAEQAKVLGEVKNDLAATKTRLEATEKRVQAIEEGLRKKGIKWSAQLRVRPEVTTNMADFHSGLDKDQNMSVSQRLRLGMDFRATDWAAGRVALQDVRTWGVNANDSADRSDPLRVFEAFVDLTLHTDYAHVKLGRQVWNFGGSRVIGKADWSQTGRAFDGADLTFTYLDFLKVDALFAVIDERNASNGTDHLFGGLYLNVPYVKGMAFDAYWLYNRDNREGAKRNFSTMGLRAAGRMPFHDALYIDLEGNWQVGTVTEGDGPTDAVTKDQDHFAAAYHAEVGYYIPEKTVRPALFLFFDSASGDPNLSPKDPKNDKSTAYLPLFPTRHALLGKMDIFDLKNIWDIGGRITLEPSALPGFRFEAEFHKLALVEEMGAVPWAATNPAFFKTPKKSADLGVEGDFSLFYQVTEELELATGYSFLVPGEGLKGMVTRVSGVSVDANGATTQTLLDYRFGQPAHWFFMQANYTF